ncbi:hypothetical protein VTL71DRAFT_11202 [Oculimacula yallundae]|uniref:Uncharacterized protein n=1 Tax=Oculimacula yallundae TaxID=86028 RepID=A0ABR4CXH2_9HELO
MTGNEGPKTPKENPSLNRKRLPDPASLRHDERSAVQISKDNDRKRRQSIPAFSNDNAHQEQEEGLTGTVDGVGESGLDDGRETVNPSSDSDTGSNSNLQSTIENVTSESEPSPDAGPPPQLVRSVACESDKVTEMIEQEAPLKALADVAAKPLVLRTTQSLETMQKNADIISQSKRVPDPPAMYSMRKRSASIPVFIPPLTSSDSDQSDQSIVAERENTSNRSRRGNSEPSRYLQDHKRGFDAESFAVDGEDSNYVSTTRDVATSNTLPIEGVRSVEDSQIESLDSIEGYELTFARHSNEFIEAQNVEELLRDSYMKLDLRSNGRDVTRSFKIPIRIRSWFRESDPQHAPCLFNIQTGLFIETRRVAFISGLLIDCYRIKTYFLAAIKSQNQKMFQTLSTIFDRYGRLRREFKHHGTKEGTSIWGDELDQGDLLIIEDVHMDEKWNHDQLAIFMVQQFIFSTHIPAFVLIDQTPFTPTLQLTDRDQDVYLESFIHVLRTLGFRRVGLSSVFALSTNPWHPSFSLSETDDRMRDSTTIEIGDETHQVHCKSDIEAVKYLWAGEDGAPRLQELNRTHPLHWATMTLPDKTCVEFYINEWRKYGLFIPDDPNLRLIFDRRKSSEVALNLIGAIFMLILRLGDQLGRNLLHIAASEQKLSSVVWLVKEFPGLTNQITSLEGLTPLEGLEAKLELFRTTQTLFEGFSPGEMRYGCTCGACVGGFMSPRTNYALVYKASELHFSLDNDKDIDDYWVDHNAGLLQYVDPKVLEDLRYSQYIRDGFINLFFHMAQVLESQAIPTTDSIKRRAWGMNEDIPHLPAAIFLEGTTEAAVQIVFQLARDCDEWAGNGYNSLYFKTLHDQHPVCRNDHEWEMVARRCGLKDLEGGVYS